MKERGIEVGRVGAWHEAKARAVEVMEVARELAGHVRDWLDRAADRVLDRLGPEPPELAFAGGRESREQGPDLATRLREAWEARKEGRERQEAETPEREAPDDLAARLRAAVDGIDRAALSDRVSTLRGGRRKASRVGRGARAGAHKRTGTRTGARSSCPP
jgi:uncharacterized protein YdeI (YjbR/CyaY-like superfamily)